MQIIISVVPVQSGLYVSTDVRPIGTTTCTHIRALKLNWICGYCYVYMRYGAAAKLESQRTAGTKTPGEGGATAAGRTKLNYHYAAVGYRTQETSGAPEGT